MSRGKELAKNTLVISIGKMSTQFLTFLLLPLYTSRLSTSEYGSVDLFITYVSLLLPVITLLIDQGAFRYMLDAMEDEEKIDEVISSSLIVVIIECFIFAGIYVLFQGFITSEYKIFILLNLIASAFSNLVLQYSRGLKDIFTYSLGSLLTTLVTIVFNVIFIAWMNLGAMGMFLATVFGNIFCFSFIFVKKRIYSHFSIKSIETNTIKKMLSYSIPLVPNQLSMWIINSSARIIVTLFLGTSANGILAISNKFSTVITTFFNIFYLSWTETVVTHFKDEDRDLFLSGMITTIFRLFACLGLGIIAFMPFMFPLLVNEQYAAAYVQIPIYILGTLCNILVGELGAIYVVTKKTKELAKSTIWSAIINIVTHLALIKFIGLYAASISTFIGYGTVMIYRVIDVKNYMDIKYDKRMFASVFLLSIGSLITYYSNNLNIQMIWALVIVFYSIVSNKDILSNIILMLRNKVKSKWNT